MQQRHRIAQQLRNSTRRHERSNLDRTFAYYFQQLTRPSILEDQEQDFQQFYSPNPDIEAQLQDFMIESELHRMFVGARGSGKSTYVRRVFGASGKPRILGDVFVISISLDRKEFSRADEVRSHIVQALRASVATLNTEKLDLVLDPKFATFLNDHDSTLLFTSPDIHDMADVTRNLESLRSQEQVAFNCYAIAYLAMARDIKSVVFVLDGMEFGNFDTALSAYRLCLAATKQIRCVGIIAKVLCCCRPVTYSSLKAHASIDGFPHSDPLRLETPKPLTELLERRFNVIIEQAGEGRLKGKKEIVSNLEAWRDAYAVLEYISGKFIYRTGDSLVLLANHDVRQAFIGLATILKNAHWYEDAEPSEGAFRINPADYRTNEAGFWRALLLQDKYYYEDGSSAYFANIFRNEGDVDSDSDAICFVRFFYTRGSDRRIFRISPEELIEEFRDIIVEQKIRFLINWARDRDLVYVESGDLNGDGKRSDVVVPLPKLFQMWTWLGRSAVPMEFLRDDTFLAHSPRNGAPQFKAGGTSAFHGEQLFDGILDFVSHVVESERRLLDRVTQKAQQQRLASFYKVKSTGDHILGGVEKSIERFFKVENWRSGPKNIVERVKNNRERIAQYEKTFHEAVGSRVFRKPR